MSRLPGMIPRTDRREVRIPAVTIRADGSRVQGSITDLSAEGCRLRSDETLAIGEHVLLEIPYRDQQSAQVRWSLMGEAGLAFKGASDQF